MNTSLIPRHYTQREHDLDSVCEASALRVGSHIWDAPVLDPTRCHESFLPLLAKFYGAELWMKEMNTEAKRQAISESIMIRRRRGTAWSVKRVVAAFDADARVVEGTSAIRYDGTYRYDGTQQHGVNDDWAKYSVMLSRPISSADDQLRFIRMLRSYAPARCHLAMIDWRHTESAPVGASASAIVSTDPESSFVIDASSGSESSTSAALFVSFDSGFRFDVSMTPQTQPAAAAHLIL